MSRRRAVQRRVDVEALKVLALPLVGVLLVVVGVVIGPAEPGPTGPREVSLVSSVAACGLPRSGPNKSEIYAGSVLKGGDAAVQLEALANTLRA